MSEPSVLALLPFLVRGSLCLDIMRAMAGRGLKPFVAFTGTASHLEPDPASDFLADGRLLDLSSVPAADAGNVLQSWIRRHDIRLLLQVGAAPLYPHLPYLKERLPQIEILDTLYNEVGHTVNHFLYERCLSGVIVESRHMQRFVEQGSFKPDPAVRVVENGIDLDRFRPGPRPQNGEGLVVGFVGRMSQEKNPLGFVDLCEKLYASLPSLSFRMVGGGPLEAKTLRRIARSPARDAFCYCGFERDVAKAYRAIDVLVVPSLLDGRPNAIMEANACGVPVIAAPVGGIPELIEQGANGHLASAREFPRIRDILAAWIAHPESLARTRSACRSLTERRFDRKRMLDGYEAVFREFLNGCAAPHQAGKSPSRALAG